jgi:Mn-dependent DtxR family transcriptional regulator
MLAVTGITNKSLRALMTGLLDGIDYARNQASYDLARLHLNGLVARVPAKNRYHLTSDGLRCAIFYTRLHDRLLRPLFAADQHPPHRKYEKLCALATLTSQNASATPDCHSQQPKTQDQSQRPSDQGSLELVR